MEPLISFKHVSYSYRADNQALIDVSFDIFPGEKVALLGLNGSGKSTLLLHANGLIQPDLGQIFVNGNLLKKPTCEIGLVFQNADDQLFMPTVEEDVAFGPQNMRLSPQEITQRVQEALEITGTTQFRSRPPFQLSGGEKRMVALATVLSMRPLALALDEPTSGLDYLATERFIEAIENLTHALMMSTHDIQLARRLCTRAIVMDKGRIIYDGDIANLTYPPC